MNSKRIKWGKYQGITNIKEKKKENTSCILRRNTWVILPSLQEVNELSSEASTILLVKFSDTKTDEAGKWIEETFPTPEKRTLGRVT